MTKTKKVGVTGRFGARYGRKIKLQVQEIEKISKAKHACPYCGYKKVSRIYAGLWQCSKCGSKFTGGAYTPSVKIELPVEKIVPVSEFEKEKRVPKNGI